MKLAVTYENGKVFQHFGHTEQFKLYDIEDGAVKHTAVVNTDGNGHGALAGFLRELHVDTLICGGIGAGAQHALSDAGIVLYGGVTGDADAAVQSLLANTLQYHPDIQCNHHDHENHGQCGHHGDHSCHCH